MNAALTKRTSVDTLIEAYRSHVLGRNLPNPASVNFSSAREILVQPSGGLDLWSRLSAVLVWACTLNELTATWTHTANDRLLVEVIGRTAGGTAITVYGGGTFDECCGLVPLARDERDGVSLDELYALVSLLREHEQRYREVA